MRGSLSVVVPALILAACAEPATTPTATLQEPDVAPAFFKKESTVIPGHYIVVYKDNVANAQEKTRSLMAMRGLRTTATFSTAIKGFAGELTPELVAAFRADPEVAFVEEDQVMWATTTQSGATWGLDRSDQRALPLSGTYTFSNTGAGVRAYIVDTGIRFDHSEFGGRATSGYDAVDGGSADDCNGHGTHVAGTVGGANYGMAKGVSLVAVRVLGCDGSGTTSGVIAGIDWVTANRVLPAVANMSLGGGASTALDNAVKNSIAAGVTYAIAAGNGNFIGIAQDACKSSPARVPEAITVSATNNTDTKASWANYGNCVDFFAPGVSITSSWYTSATATNTISGTSMATPHVAGAAALYLQSNTAATPQQVRDALFNNTTKNIVTSSKTTNAHLLFVNY